MSRGVVWYFAADVSGQLVPNSSLNQSKHTFTVLPLNMEQTVPKRP